MPKKLMRFTSYLSKGLCKDPEGNLVYYSDYLRLEEELRSVEAERDQGARYVEGWQEAVKERGEELRQRLETKIAAAEGYWMAQPRSNYRDGQVTALDEAMAIVQSVFEEDADA